MSGELTEDAGVKKELNRRNKNLDVANRQLIDAAREELGLDTLFIGYHPPQHLGFRVGAYRTGRMGFWRLAPHKVS